MELSRRSALRLLRLMLVASVLLPSMLLGYVAWSLNVATRQLVGEQDRRAVDVMHEHALQLLRMSGLLLRDAEQLVAQASEEQISAEAQRIRAALAGLRS